jgi:hypothetical protein
MTDYLASMIARSRDGVGAVRPRVGSLFESPQVIVEAPEQGPAPDGPAPREAAAGPALGPVASPPPAPPPAPPGGEPAAAPSPMPADAARPVRPRAPDSPAGTGRPASGTGSSAGREAQAEGRPDQGARLRGRARRGAGTSRPAQQAAASRPSVEQAPPAGPGEAGSRTPARASRRSRTPAAGDFAATAGSARAPSGAVAAGAASVDPSASVVPPSSATPAWTVRPAVDAVDAGPGVAPAWARGERAAVAASRRRRGGSWVQAVIPTVASELAGDIGAAGGDEPAPVVQVTIGRVEVRASVPAPAVPPARPAPSPAMTLDDYLRRRTSRRGP